MKIILCEAEATNDDLKRKIEEDINMIDCMKQNHISSGLVGSRELMCTQVPEDTLLKYFYDFIGMTKP